MRRGLSCALAVALWLVAAPGARADFHLIKISEVFPGTSAAFDKAFVELKTVAPGQTNLGGHAITIYDATGALVNTTPIPGPVANGETGRTILLGDIDVTNRDFAANIGTLVDRTGGAVCFESVDCVSWGSFPPATPLPSPAGTPAAAIPAPEMTASDSLVRVESANCPTFLDPLDDTNDSSLDFTITPTETPQANSAPVAGSACDTDPPQTTIEKAPKMKSVKRRAKFRFSSDEPGSSFECSLDKRKFKPCPSPFKRSVKVGKHSFAVRATDAAGNVDETPAKAKFRRLAKP